MNKAQRGGAPAKATDPNRARNMTKKRGPCKKAVRD
jgi:hypothetical protein